MSQDEIIQPANWGLLQSYLYSQAAMGASGSPTADTGTITGLDGVSRMGCVLGLDGRIYSIPRNATSVLIVDTKANEVFCENVALSAYFNKS